VAKLRQIGELLRSLRILVSIGGLIVAIGCSEICIAGQASRKSTRAEPVYRCDTAGIHLLGTLAERTFYGPPNFGKTPAKDVRDKVLVLKLENPITVEPIENAEAKNSANLNTFRHVRQVQLFFSRAEEANARKLLGRAVLATGSLDEATAPRQYTDVTMEVKTLNPANTTR
jgi:hypothetical protein